MEIGERFDRFIRTFTLSDGRPWTLAEIATRSGGRLKPNYLSLLRAGKIRNPGYEKLAAISEVMGFPVSLWYEPAERVRSIGGNVRLAQRLEDLMAALADPVTGRPYTNARVAAETKGVLSEADVAALRAGAMVDPGHDLLRVLAAALGVDPAYFTHDTARVLTEQDVLALAQQESSAIVHKTLALTEQDRRAVVGLLDHLRQRAGKEGD